MLGKGVSVIGAIAVTMAIVLATLAMMKPTALWAASLSVALVAVYVLAPILVVRPGVRGDSAAWLACWIGAAAVVGMFMLFPAPLDRHPAWSAVVLVGPPSAWFFIFTKKMEPSRRFVSFVFSALLVVYLSPVALWILIRAG